MSEQKQTGLRMDAKFALHTNIPIWNGSEFQSHFYGKSEVFSSVTLLLATLG